MIILATLRSAERRLDFWRNVCGCHAGALAVLVAIGWVVAEVAQGAAPVNTATVLRGAAIVIGAGVAAKLAAILAARALYAADAALLARRSRRLPPDERVRA